MLKVGKNHLVVEELLGNGLLSCSGYAGRLGGWGHASRRPVFTARRIPSGGPPAAGALLPLRSDAWIASHVAAGPQVRPDLRDRGDADAGCKGAWVPGIAAASEVLEGTVRPWLRRFRVSASGCGSSSPGWQAPSGRSSTAGPGGQRTGRCGGGGRRGCPARVGRRRSNTSGVAALSAVSASVHRSPVLIVLRMRMKPRAPPLRQGLRHALRLLDFNAPHQAEYRTRL
jgi:hypothetical protein